MAAMSVIRPLVVGLAMLTALIVLSEPPASASKRVLWVGVEGGRRLAEVNLARGRVVRQVALPGAPHNVTVSPHGDVVATLPAAGRLAIFDGRRLRLASLGASPHDVKVARGIAWVTNEGASRIDRVRLDGRILRAIGLPAEPHDLAIAPNRRIAWVSMDATDDIAVIDLVGARVRRYLHTGGRPHDLRFAPSGRQVWVSDWDGSVRVFTAGGRRLGILRRGVEPHHLTFSPDGRRVWITDNGGHRVLVYRVRDRRLLASRPTGGAPHHLAFTRDATRVVVVDHGLGRVLVFAADTMRRIRSIPVGPAPHGIWAAP